MTYYQFLGGRVYYLTDEVEMWLRKASYNQKSS